MDILTEAISILPYVFARSQDENFEEIQDDFIDWMENYAKVYQSNYRSNQKGYQSPDDFYLDKSFAPFLNYMSERILALVETYKKHDDVEIDFIPRLSNMWFNINYKGSYNTYHSHPGSCLAGILYVNVLIILETLLFIITMSIVFLSHSTQQYHLILKMGTCICSPPLWHTLLV